MTRRKGRRLRIVVLALGVAAAVVMAIGLRSRSLQQVVEDLDNLPERLAARVGPAASGEAVQGAAQRQALEGLARHLDARILWSSNRDGNHEIYLLDLRTLAVTRLTDDPHVDFLGRFSPDGKRIVFLRSRPEWVSVRDTSEWDVWVMNADGTEQRLVAERGFRPAWAADGTSVIFDRGRQALRVDVEGGQESVVFEPPAEFPSIRYGDLALSHDGRRIAVAVEGGEAVVWNFVRSRYTKLQGEYICQPVWPPSDDFILYIEAVGHGGTRVMRARPGGAEPSVFMDLPGEYSHEYFPKLSNDGDWLVWGAAAEGHEHDRADYEIFVWRIGDPWETATRVTYYTGNDMWPDIYVGTVASAGGR